MVIYGRPIEVVLRHPNGVKEHGIRNPLPSMLIVQQVEAGLQLRYSPVLEEAGERSARSQLVVQDEIIPPTNLSEIGVTVSHGLNRGEQVSIAGTQIALR